MRPMGKDATLGIHIFLGIKTMRKRVFIATENHRKNYGTVGHIYCGNALCLNYEREKQWLSFEFLLLKQICYLIQNGNVLT